MADAIVAILTVKGKTFALLDEIGLEKAEFYCDQKRPFLCELEGCGDEPSTASRISQKNRHHPPFRLWLCSCCKSRLTTAKYISLVDERHLAIQATAFDNQVPTSIPFQAQDLERVTYGEWLARVERPTKR
jgi:hypothetical protein